MMTPFFLVFLPQLKNSVCFTFSFSYVAVVIKSIIQYPEPLTTLVLDTAVAVSSPVRHLDAIQILQDADDVAVVPQTNPATTTLLMFLLWLISPRAIRLVVMRVLC